MNNVAYVANLIKRRRPNWPLPIRLIGEGAEGKVFNTNNGRVLKLTRSNATKEFNMLKRLRGAHYAPQVRNNNIVKNFNGKNSKNIHQRFFRNSYAGRPQAFIMSKVGSSNGMTLVNYFKKFPNANKNNAYNRLTEQLMNLQLRGILHGNMHRGNVIVTVTPTGQITGMWLIDFGMARSLAPNGYSSRNIAIVEHLRGKYNKNLNSKLRAVAKRRTENLKSLTSKKPRRNSASI